MIRNVARFRPVWVKKTRHSETISDRKFDTFIVSCVENDGCFLVQTPHPNTKSAIVINTTTQLTSPHNHSSNRCCISISPPPLPSNPARFRSNPGPHVLQNSARPLTGYSTYRIHLIKVYISLHSCQILSPSETGFFIVSAHRLTKITLLTLIATLQLEGESPTYILNEDTQLVYARSEYHTQLAKMSFDEIFDLTAGVYFHFLYIYFTKSSSIMLVKGHIHSGTLLVLFSVNKSKKWCRRPPYYRRGAGRQYQLLNLDIVR